MIILDTESKIRCIRYQVKYERRYHGIPEEFRIPCRGEEDLAEAKAMLADMLIPFTVENEEPSEAELRQEGVKVGSYQEAEQLISGKEVLTLEKLREENALLTAAVLELGELMSGVMSNG